MLKCSEPGGKAYVETSNIDGETNLKLRSSAFPKSTNLEQWNSLKGEVQYEQPNSNIHKFEGTLAVEGMDVSIYIKRIYIYACYL